MSFNDHVPSLIVALGLALTTACGSAPHTGDLEDVGAESADTARALAPNADDVVEKGGSILSGQPSFIDFGVAGFGDAPSRQWIIAATQRSELVVALDVEPFSVDPIGCAVIEPTDPALRRCVLTITFNVPGEAGTYEATLAATDIDGNATSIDVVGVGEGVVF